ncbi:MAG TPA: CBS domain-containing protein [Streptosporangiaceae bacterium]
MQVRDVMTDPSVTESAQGSLRSAAERMWRQQTGSLIIAAEGHISGIITERDVLRALALGADPDRTSVDDAMTTEVVTVPPDMPLHEAARQMAARWIRHLPVVQDGRLLGVVSMRDVTGVFAAMSADDGDVRVEHEFDQLVREQRLHRSKPGDADRP